MSAIQRERLRLVVEEQRRSTRLTSRSGIRFSVAAFDNVCCMPRNNRGPYTHVEVLALGDSGQDERSRLGHELGVTFDDYGVAAYVPVESVRAIL